MDEHAHRVAALEAQTAAYLRQIAKIEAENARLKAAVEAVDAVLTPESVGEWVRAYVMPAGPWHRLLGLARQ